MVYRGSARALPALADVTPTHAIALGIVASVVTAALLAYQRLVVGSAEGGWVYGYVANFHAAVLLPWLAVAAVCAALLWSQQYLRRSSALLLTVWILAATGMHGLLRSYAPYDLEALFVSPAANAFYTVTQQHPPQDVLGKFARVRSTAPLHMRSNMPGKTMLLYGLETLTSRPELLAWLLVLVSNAGAVLMFLFVRDLFDDRTAAWHAAILYLFVPARLYFLPLMNTVTPVVALGYAWLVVRWLRTGDWSYALASAVALYVLVFFEPLPLVLGLLFVALAWRAISVGHLDVTRFALQGSAIVLAFIVVAEIVFFASNFNLIAAMRQIGKHAVEFNAQDGRPYGVWVRANLLEFAFGVGACQLALWIWSLIDWRRAPDRGRRLREPLLILSVVLPAIVLVTNLIGINRGEVLRLWIFLACFFQIPAAYATARMDSRLAVWLIVVFSALPVSLAVAMIAFVVP